MPLPSQHAECERCEQDNFFVYRPCDEEMKNVLISRNVLQLTNRDGYKYASESDIAGFVVIFLKDIIFALKLDILVNSEIGIKNIRPDLWY